MNVSGPPVQPPVNTFSVFESDSVVSRPAPVSSETEPRASSTPMVPVTVTTGTVCIEYMFFLDNRCICPAFVAL